jgi:hypothetical protein
MHFLIEIGITKAKILFKFSAFLMLILYFCGFVSTILEKSLLTTKFLFLK